MEQRIIKRPILLLGLVLLAVAGCQGPPSRDVAEETGFDAGAFPIGYRLGSFDERFNIAEDEFVEIVREAKEVWERPAGRVLFRFDSAAAFRINLIFDDRQERTLEAKRVKANLDLRGRSYDLLVWQHTKLSGRLMESESSYEDAAREFNGRMEKLNSTIAKWNERGGAPEEEFAAIQREQEELREAEQSLERRREEVNNQVREVNELVEEINKIAEENNIQVTLFNGRFVEGREFEQGIYTGREINIFQFRDHDDLRIALVHEFGHALGFGHVDDPSAIMYYKFEKQDPGNPTLTKADLALLKNKFPRN